MDADTMKKLGIDPKSKSAKARRDKKKAEEAKAKEIRLAAAKAAEEKEEKEKAAVEKAALAALIESKSAQARKTRAKAAETKALAKAKATEELAAATQLYKEKVEKAMRQRTTLPESKSAQKRAAKAKAVAAQAEISKLAAAEAALQRMIASTGLDAEMAKSILERANWEKSRWAEQLKDREADIKVHLENVRLMKVRLKEINAPKRIRFSKYVGQIRMHDSKPAQLRRTKARAEEMVLKAKVARAQIEKAKQAKKKVPSAEKAMPKVELDIDKAAAAEEEELKKLKEKEDREAAEKAAREAALEAAKRVPKEAKLVEEIPDWWEFNLEEKLRKEERTNFLTKTEYFMAVALLSEQRCTNVNQSAAVIISDKYHLVRVAHSGPPRETKHRLKFFKDYFAADCPDYFFHSAKKAIDGCRGASLKGYTMIHTRFPCHGCADAIIASGLKKIIYLAKRTTDMGSTFYSATAFATADVECVKFKSTLARMDLNLHRYQRTANKASIERIEKRESDTKEQDYPKSNTIVPKLWKMIKTVPDGRVFTKPWKSVVEKELMQVGTEDSDEEEKEDYEEQLNIGVQSDFDEKDAEKQDFRRKTMYKGSVVGEKAQQLISDDTFRGFEASVEEIDEAEIQSLEDVDSLYFSLLGRLDSEDSD